MYEFSEFKIAHHLDAVRSILAGGNPPPITFEIDPTNVCNHRCIWCIDGRFNREYPATLPMAVLERFLGEIAAAGVRSVVLKGGGEPLCHPDIDAILRCARGEGLRTGIITNGQLLTEHAEAVKECCEWVRVSLDAAQGETHRRIHRPGAADAFEHILAGIERLAPEVFLGLVFVTAAENAGEMYEAAHLAKKLGARYITFREVLRSPGAGEIEPGWIATARDAFRRAYADLHDGIFRIFGSGGPRGEVHNPKPVPYDRCDGPRLVGILCADAKLYPCCSLRFREDYCFGSIADASFREIWDGPRRREVLGRIEGKACRHVCPGLTTYLRYDHYNRLFQYLAAEAGHVEFV